MLLAPDNSITPADAAAETWLAELREDGRRAAPAGGDRRGEPGAQHRDGHAATGAIARARVRTASGRWLLVRGSTLGDDADAQTAVIIEPARPHELAPLIADAYGLTERERAVTQLVAQGLHDERDRRPPAPSRPGRCRTTSRRSSRRSDVSTRGELVARMFFDHYAPRLTDAQVQAQ